MIKYDTDSLNIGDVIPCEHTMFTVIKTELTGRTGCVTKDCDWGFYKAGDEFTVIGQDRNDGDIYVNLNTERKGRYEWYVPTDCLQLNEI